MRSLTLACLALLVGCGNPPSAGSGGGAGGSGSGAGGGSAVGGGSGGAGGSSAVGGGAGGSGGAGGTGGSGGGSSIDGGIVDLDRDGLDDAWEDLIARTYLPVLAVHPQDGCPLGGLVFRVRRHPANPALLNIIYDHLFQDDCGVTAHVGDNEAFAITVNPAKPAPLGITAVKAISHQNTACQKVSECGTCGGLTACGLQPDGGARPLIFSSKDKHGGYASLAVCNNILSCLDACAVGERTGVPMVNVGEPDAHFTENLSADGGFINAANGWTKAQLYDHNPWDPTKDFGTAGNVAGDLLDPAFVAAPCN